MSESVRRYDLEWSGVTMDMARQILYQAEKFLESQLQAGIAADQRAITGASVFSGFAVAVVGGALAHWTENHDRSFMLAGIAAAVTLLLAAASCMYAGRSVDFHYPGAVPDRWWAIRYYDLVQAIGGETENYQERIETNAEILSANADWMERGTALAILSPVVALSVWLLL